MADRDVSIQDPIVIAWATASCSGWSHPKNHLPFAISMI